jgi:hypothetical protein
MSATLVSSRPLLTAEAFIALQPSLVNLLGRSAATVLASLHSWLRHSRNLIDGVYWVYNTYAQWKDQIPGLSIRTLQRVMSQLESLGIIHSKRYEAHRWYQRKWYTIDYERLEALLNPPLPPCPAPSRQNGGIINKDIPPKKNIEITNTDAKSLNFVKPPTHPVWKKEEIDKGNIASEAPPTGQDPIKENPEIKGQEPPKPPQETPKPKPKQTPNDRKETIAPEIEAQVIETIAPLPFNQNLRKQVLAAQLDVIQDALTLVNQQKSKGKVKNPIALLVSALQNKWKPNPTPQPIAPLIPDDFNEWFELARRANLVLASQLIDGVLCICTRTQDWEPYEDFRAGFTLPWLKRILWIPIPDRSPPS